tara:strand:- start:175 stop:498 length:324 start_codon:yes stop_codon:yes gene_type:complete
MAIPLNDMPNRLDMMRAQAEVSTPPMPAAPMRDEPAMPESGGLDRLAALLGGMEEDAPMMPEEEPVADDTSTVASAIASAALANSGTPEEALKALIEAADQIRETLT